MPLGSLHGLNMRLMNIILKFQICRLIHGKLMENIPLRKKFLPALTLLLFKLHIGSEAVFFSLCRVGERTCLGPVPLPIL